MVLKTQGDYEALTRVLRQFFRNRTRSFDIDDLVQETLIKVHYRRSQYNPDKKFITWVYAIAQNVLIDEIRKMKRKKNIKAIDLDANLTADLAEPPEYEEPDHRELLAYINSLEPMYKDLIKYIYLEQHTIWQAALHFHTPRGTIKSRLHTALQQLRRCYHVDQHRIPIL